MYACTYIAIILKLKTVGGKTNRSLVLLFLSLMDFDLNASHRNFTRVLNPTKEQSF